MSIKDDLFAVRYQARPQMQIDASIQVSNGEVFLPHMTLITISGRYFIVQHKVNAIPRAVDILECKCAENFNVKEVDFHLYKDLFEVVKDWDEVEHKAHLSPFTYIVVAMRAYYDWDVFYEGVFDV